MMKVLKKLVLLSFFSSVLFASASEPFMDSLKIQGQTRRFWMIIPDGVQQNAPLVFVLHGYGNPGKKETWMTKAAEKHKFAICIPCGWKDPKGKPSWNVGYPSQKGWKVDEVAGMEKLAKHVQKKYKLSKENTFLTGMSNGGEMCYLLAYSKQKTFKAFASLSGLTMEWIYRTMDAPKPVPFFEIHGTADYTSEWTGDLENKGGWGAYMAVPISIGYWIAKNKCEKETKERVDGLNKSNNRYINKYKYSGGPTGCQVWLYEVVNGPHSWFDKDINIGEEVWSFFSMYLK